MIGTGPSLNKTNLSLLNSEILFATNKFYKNDFNLYPMYWVVADPNVFKDCYQDLLKLNTTLFLTDGAGQVFLHNANEYLKEAKTLPIVTRPLSDMKSTMEFSKDMLKGVNGGMVTLSCLQIAYYMGFKEVYLIGCDCSSKGQHYYKDKDNYISEEDDWNKLFKTYEVCKKVYEENGRKIYNATVGGNLEVFERVKLEDVI